MLRGLDFLRATGIAPDPRAAEAIEIVRSKRTAEGRWFLDREYPGGSLVTGNEGEGRPSRWITLRALRVLRWFEGPAAG